MQNNEAYYRALLSGFIDNKLSPDEVNELLELIHSQPSRYNDILNSPEIKSKLSEQAYNNDINVSEAVSARMKERLMAAVQEDGSGEDMSADRQADLQDRKPLFRMLTGNWRRVAAAAVVIAVATTVVVSVNRQSKSNGVDVVQSTVNDVSPGGNRATLQLANGEVIVLDSAANGSLATQGNAKIVKLANGQIAYNVEGKVAAEVMYNTMSTPPGGQYQLKLPDGTDVWLNAASSITYPTAFMGKERTVTITGEVYFEVAKSPLPGGGMRPFLVEANSVVTEVLGTHFNVNAYGDDGNTRITLLEGSVKTSMVNGQSSILKPGQQALINQSTIQLINPDLDQVMAWKNGLFNFNKVSLQEVMKQIARWYDVDIEYQGAIRPKKFGGEIQRDLNLSEVLEGLRQTGVHFRIEGKKLIVLP